MLCRIMIPKTYIFFLIGKGTLFKRETKFKKIKSNQRLDEQPCIPDPQTA